MSIEQINNSTGTVTYLHHDQAGSTRLLTGSTGTVTGKCTYGPYGTPTCEGTTTTPLGYDAQYTSSDTGLIYMRAREYDPATDQFLSVDPLDAITGAPYYYADDNPVNEQDRTGLGEELELCYPGGCISLGGSGSGTGSGKQGLEEIIEKNVHEFEGGLKVVAKGIKEGAESILNEAKGGGGNSAQEKKLTDKEIKELEEAGYHPHELKPGGPSEDLYSDRQGNITTKPKNQRGAPGEPTGLNIKELGCGPF
jgi:RHS repeat-associated protein